MKSWNEFCLEEPELARLGKNMLFQSRIGLAFLATIRKDGAPRLHPVSLVISNGHLYVFIPPASPKCADLLRDGRYAMQAFSPPSNKEGEEFYLAGRAECIQDPAIQQALIEDENLHVQTDEILFEILLDRAMYKKLEKQGTSDEHPIFVKWRATSI
jgi:hypothetical protein